MEEQQISQECPIKLADGKERMLRYSLDTLILIKQEFGVSVLAEGASALFKKVDETNLARLIVLGLDHEAAGGWPGVKEEQIRKLVFANTALPILKALFIALAAQTQPKNEPAPPETPSPAALELKPNPVM
jgi:hypothetical protein